MAAYMEIVEVEYGADAKRRLEEASRNPWLVLWPSDCLTVELIPLEAPGHRFRFEPGLRMMDSQEVERICECDEIVIEGERLLLLEDGAPCLDLSVHGFVWWYRWAFQAPFWSNLLNLRALTKALADGPVAPLERAGVAEDIERLFPGFQGLVVGLLGEVRDSALDIEILESTSKCGIEFRVRSGNVSAMLRAQPSSIASAWLFRTGPIAFLHDPEESLEGRERKRMVALLSRRLSQALRRRFS